jgi:tRNA threonylcarbamoyladenosine biosynthesis protein TsaE
MKKKEETFLSLSIRNEEETKAFGHQLADRLEPGSVVALIGDLGTGKTTLSKYIAEGLGITEVVTSPTFTIVQEYHSGRLPLYHFDVYRIGDISEMEELGYEEYFFGDGVSLVEWADIIQELLPEETRIIRIEYGREPEERIYHCNF